MKTRRITANIPVELLEQAQKALGEGITETLVAGLEALVRKSSLSKAEALKGKIRLVADKGRRSDSSGN